jgi:two-component system, sensor histidine kinase
MRILIVEDDEDVQLVFAVALERLHEVAFSKTIDDALQRIEQRFFDVAIVDINLGRGQVGTELARRLIETGRSDRPRLIACTAYVMPGDREMLVASGFDAYLAKPFMIDELLALVDEVHARVA